MNDQPNVEDRRYSISRLDDPRPGTDGDPRRRSILRMIRAFEIEQEERAKLEYALRQAIERVTHIQPEYIIIDLD